MTSNTGLGSHHTLRIYRARRRCWQGVTIRCAALRGRGSSRSLRQFGLIRTTWANAGVATAFHCFLFKNKSSAAPIIRRFSRTTCLIVRTDSGARRHRKPSLSRLRCMGHCRMHWVSKHDEEILGTSAKCGQATECTNRRKHRKHRVCAPGATWQAASSPSGFPVSTAMRKHTTRHSH